MPVTIELEPEEYCIRAVLDEAKEATTKHGNFRTAHEMYGVLLEEVDEVWDIVKMKRKNRSKEHLINELVQVAAMAIKGIQSIDNFVN